MFTTILFILMVTVFLSYVSYIWIKYGIQVSISESYYVLKENDDKSWLFIAFCWLFAFPAMILGSSYLMTLAGAGIVFVGAAAAMHTFPTRTVHLVGAIGGMILAGIAMIIQYHMWYMTAGVAVLAVLALLLNKKHAMWWTELIIFAAITIVLGIALF